MQINLGVESFSIFFFFFFFFFGGGGGSSEVNFNTGGGRGYCKAYVHTCMHTNMYAHAYIHIYTCLCIRKIKAIMNGCPFIRNQIYNFSTSKRGKFWQVFSDHRRILLFFLDTQAWTKHLLCHLIIPSSFVMTPQNIHIFINPPKY